MSNIPLKPNSNRRVVITDDTLAFKNWKVRLDDITGLSFGLHSMSGYLSSSGAYVKVHTASSIYKIATNNIGVLGYLEAKDNIQQITDAIRQTVAPRLLRNFLTYIFAQGIPVDIARFTLSQTGLSYRGFMRTTHVAWMFKLSCRATNRIRWDNTTVYGIQEVFYFNPQTSKNAVLGTVSSSDMNGFMLPIILEVIATGIDSQGNG